MQRLLWVANHLAFGDFHLCHDGDHVISLEAWRTTPAQLGGAEPGYCCELECAERCGPFDHLNLSSRRRVWKGTIDETTRAIGRASTCLPAGL